MFLDGHARTASLNVFGLGLNEDNNLIVAAVVNDTGYGRSDKDFPKEWTEAQKKLRDSYPGLYYFVASNLEHTISKEEADKNAASIWDDSGNNEGDYNYEDDYDEED